ncbi:hypothetical protein EUGRSUZ_H01529 [Eucalyptus grandis]|uniref:Uncharacterized protein n=2 Tax=Eucalyptus grandis TaxID=71139 RepID=A0ACC3JP15_EUCGR|nr:hypothetical protein EUGRSUZ_H01529 [Eucalyptus grandis]
MTRSSVVFPIGKGGEGAARRTLGNRLSAVAAFLRRVNGEHDNRRVVHGIKVGIALVLASLVSFVGPLYKIFKEDAAWAVMTVVVMFEFYAGATLSKGLNRAVGTLSGGMLGYLSGVLAKLIHTQVGNDIGVGIAIFMFGAAATYARSIPCIKRKYDYGGMIFILSFSLVAVSGVQSKHYKDILTIAVHRLGTVMIGFAASLVTSLFIFPIWAGAELHTSMAPKFELLACSMEDVRRLIKEPCELVASSLTTTLRELGESIMNMRRCQSNVRAVQKLRTSWLVLRLYTSPAKLENVCDSSQDLTVSSFVFLLTEMVEKLEWLVKEVEDLGDLAKFKINDI